MDGQQFWADVLSSLTTAGIIAGMAWGYSWIRNHRLEANLKESISPNGVGIEYRLVPLRARFTVQIHNYTTSYIRVRKVVLAGERSRVELMPKLDSELSQIPLSNEIARPKFRRLFLSRGPLEEDNNTGSRLLPPKTMGFWEVNSHDIGQHDWKFTHGFIVFEYGTVFGNIALVRMDMPATAFNLIKKSLEELNTCYRERRPLPDPIFAAAAKPTAERING